MVKREITNCSICDDQRAPQPPKEPDVPPGFTHLLPITPPTTTGAAAGGAGGAARENGGGTVQARRTARKRVQPRFYSPPVKPLGQRSRGRGRPPKQRSVAQLWEIASTPAANQLEEQISKAITSPISHQQVGPAPNMRAKTHNVAVARSQESGSVTCTSAPHDPKGATNVLNSDLNSTIDPKILQNVANALNYVGKTQAALDKISTKTTSAFMGMDVSNTLQAINKKHGDITRDCSLQSDHMKSYVLCCICNVVEALQKKQLKDIDGSALNSYYSAVQDAEGMKLKVEWLRSRLDEIRDAVNEANNIMEEKNRRTENIENMKRNVQHRRVEKERLESEIQEMESKLALEIVTVEELSKKMKSPTSKYQRLQLMPLMGGLI